MVLIPFEDIGNLTNMAENHDNTCWMVPVGVWSQNFSKGSRRDSPNIDGDIMAMTSGSQRPSGRVLAICQLCQVDLPC